VVAAPGWGAGGELELAPFVRDQAGSGEGIVLVLDGQVPGEDGHLPGGGHDRLLVAATGSDPSIERPQWSGGPHRGPRRLDEDSAHVGAAGLGDPAVDPGGVAGLAHLGVEADIGDQLVRVGEAGEVTDCGDDADPGNRVDPGDGHQPGHHRVGQGLHGELTVHDRQLTAVEVELAQQRLHGRGLIVGQVLPGQPGSRSASTANTSRPRSTTAQPAAT
jgi:hypothetical protein